MPKPPQVDPSGEFIPNTSRGTLMGNRGCLHDDDGNIVKKSQRPAWVSCLTSFAGRKRALLQPGFYTELFFLDEATALAAGHRPCNTCRRSDAQLFAALWSKGNAQSTPASTASIDVALNQEPPCASGDELHPGSAYRHDGAGRSEQGLLPASWSEGVAMVSCRILRACCPIGSSRCAEDHDAGERRGCAPGRVHA